MNFYLLLYCHSQPFHTNSLPQEEGHVNFLSEVPFPLVLVGLAIGRHWKIRVREERGVRLISTGTFIVFCLTQAWTLS
jgi:hypothetical protein